MVYETTKSHWEYDRLKWRSIFNDQRVDWSDDLGLKPCFLSLKHTVTHIYIDIRYIYIWNIYIIYIYTYMETMGLSIYYGQSNRVSQCWDDLH